MNIREDIKQLKTSDRDLHKFGLVVGGVFAVLGGLLLLRGKWIAPWMLWPGIVLIAAGLTAPKLLRWIYIAWMSVAFVLGFVMAHVILTLFFFLVITPIGLVARLAGKDFLSLKLDRTAQSYWIPRARKEHKPTDYERQF
jgi:hypothetical protein